MTYPMLRLKPKKEISVKRRHPWVFSGALAGNVPPLDEGEHVQLSDASGNVLATGHFGGGSIALRILHFGESKIDQTFYTKALGAAKHAREALGLSSKVTTGYRLIHGEADGLPGLVIDIYEKVAVVQAHSAGMENDSTMIENALRELFKQSIEHVVHKSASEKQGYMLPAGLPGETIFSENGIRFKANWAKGQKTGFFLDQRDNRALLGAYAKGRKVLNAFCYTGGFSMYALAAGAREVHSLDSSNKALELVEEHLVINGLSAAQHRNISADALKYLNSPEAADEAYDLIVLDPPAFAKHRNARHAAVQAYKRLNARAIHMAPEGSILFTFSCSQVVDKALFNHTITAAAMEAGRQVRILHQLHQPADHPISIFHPEGEYLKGLVLYIS